MVTHMRSKENFNLIIITNLYYFNTNHFICKQNASHQGRGRDVGLDLLEKLLFFFSFAVNISLMDLRWRGELGAPIG